MALLFWLVWPLLSVFTPEHVAHSGSHIPGTVHSADGPVDTPCDSIPYLNREIIGIVRQQVGKTVDRGECWDLAAMALNRTGARWDGMYIFGRKVDPSRECIFPGDIIQFEGVKVRYLRNRAVYVELMAHHTAVINEVRSKWVFVMAHQNTTVWGRKVGLSDLDLRTIVRGRYQIFRPVY